MKTKLLISFFSALLISSSAFADSAKMKVELFEGQLVTQENVRIESVKFEAGFNFCAGFCGTGLDTGVKQIKMRLQASTNRKAVNFQALESPSLRGRSFFEKFSYCGVQITVTGTEATGAKFSAKSLVNTSDSKGDCARGAATPYLPKPLVLKSYMSNGDLRIYSVSQ